MTSSENSTKTAAAKPSPAKPEAAAKDDTSASKPAATKRAATKAPTASAPAGAGPYWVQIGAFKDPGTAKRVAAKLREENFKVEESIKRVGGSASTTPAPTVATPAPPGAPTDQYDVFVSGMSVEELNKRLTGKGMTAEPASGGVVVKPSLPLRDAVALSKDLAVDGFKVQVRRAGGGATAPAVVSAPTAPAEGGQTLHRVRVGAFTDRAAALAAARELESKGFKPYIARGDQ
jgi:cell division septation protein DedD